jgi:hypothetical protein
MRLREIRHLLEHYSDKFTYSARGINNNSDYEITGLQSVFNAINELSVLDFLEDDIKRFQAFGPIYYSKTPNDVMHLKADTYHKVKFYIEIAAEKVNGFQTLIDNSIPKQEDNIVSVKLPPYKELGELSTFFKTLNTAFQSGLMNNEIKGSYEFKNFDTGSSWVDIIINSTVVLQFFGNLIQTAQNVHRNTIEAQLMRTQLERLDLQREAMESVKEALDNSINAVVNAEIDNLTGNKNYDPEAIAELKLSVKTFAQLINEGAQFHPPLNSPQEVTQAFPEVPRTEQITGPAGLLEQLSSNLGNNQIE